MNTAPCTTQQHRPRHLSGRAALCAQVARVGALCATLAGCQGIEADPGLDALMVIDEARFVPGAMPGPSGGPEIAAVINLTNEVRPGEVDWPLSGTLAPEATGLLVGLVGDRGHWRVVADTPEVTQPTLPTFDLSVAFSGALLADPLELELAAVDRDGRVGPTRTVTLALERPPIPEGELVVTLAWDRDADLDLRVTDPSGVEINARNPNSASPSRPGQPPTPEELAAGGALDLDSNAQCLIDGVRQENVVWGQPPPPGRYQVRVDTFSLCGQPSARWVVEVRRSGELVARAEGFSTDLDQRFNHDIGAGVLALEFQEDAR